MLSPEAGLAPHRAAARAAAPQRRVRAPRRRSARCSPAPIAATTDLPAGDVSALDGFAFAGDLAAGRDAAGRRHGRGRRRRPGPASRRARRSRSGPARRCPLGADRVVAIEDDRQARRRRSASAARGRRRRRARSAARGEVVAARRAAAAGRRPASDPAALSLLASQGIDDARRPSPAAGRDPHHRRRGRGRPTATPAPGAAARLAHRLPARRRRAGSASSFDGLPASPADDAELLASASRPALERHDVLLVCGGVSRGELRPPRGASSRGSAARPSSTAVAIQPGKPLVVGAPRRALALRPARQSRLGDGRLRALRRRRRSIACAAAPRGFWSDACRVELAAALRRRQGRAIASCRPRGAPAAAAAARGRSRARGSHDLAAFARADLLLRVRAGDAAARRRRARSRRSLALGGRRTVRMKRVAEAHGNRTHLRRRQGRRTTVLKTAEGTSPRALPRLS